MTNEKICFRYDGSPEAEQALKWINKTFNKYWYQKHGDHFTNEGKYIWKKHDINFTYQLVPPAEFLRIVKGEPEPKWKVGDECEYDILSIGTINKGKIIAIYENVAWIKASEIQNPITLSLSVLRPVRKSLREEILHLVAQHHKKQYQDITDEIIELIKERRNEL